MIVIEKPSESKLHWQMELGESYLDWLPLREGGRDGYTEPKKGGMVSQALQDLAI